jgi:hypothetical protein
MDMARRKRGNRKGKIWQYPLVIGFAVFLLLFFMPPVLAQPEGQPQDRLGMRQENAPLTPEEAHKQLEERTIKWPERLGGDGARIADVQPGLRINIPVDIVEGYTSNAGAQVKVEVVRGASVIGTVNTTTNARRWFHADFQSIADILSGDKVRVTDLVSGPAVEVDCTLNGTIDTGADTVAGTAPSGNAVDVYIVAPSTYLGDVPPGLGVAHKGISALADTYTASFSGLFNLMKGDAAYIFSSDPNGNSVLDVINTGGSLVVYPQYDEVLGYYQPSTSLTVNAGGAILNTSTAKDGFFEAWFLNHDIIPGETVSCMMGVNRSITVENVSSSCDPITQVVTGTAPPNRTLRITMDAYGQPVVIETVSDASGGFRVDLANIYQVTGNERYNVTWYNDAGDAVVYEFQAYSWYLPEGYTGKGFDEWVLVMNPTSTLARVRVVFQTLQGQVEGPLLSCQPNSRSTVHVNEWVPEQHVSTMVTSIDGVMIMAERAMYMYQTVDGKWGAHDSIGILNPSSIWYLPEGATLAGFDEWVLIQNPNAVAVNIKVQFLGKTGVARELQVIVEARSRYTIHANEFIPNAEISTKVECLTQEGGQALAIFAERAMYMATKDGKRGAHDSIGLSTPAPSWFLAEGTTRPGFDEWVLLMNPNNAATTAVVTFMTPEGVAGNYEMAMPGNSRGTIHVNDFVKNKDVSIMATSNDGAGILAERAMYMNTPDGKRDAHDSIGSYATNNYWYLPEGTTRAGFDEWILVQNPNSRAAEVRLTLLGPQGIAAQRSFSMQANSRLSIHVNEIVNNTDMSAVVESLGSDPPGILAERAMYMWTRDFKQGATGSIGIPSF